MSAAQKTRPTVEERQFWETPRRVSHEEAQDSIKRFVDRNFCNDGEAPRISIPANSERDDDLLLHSYVAQQRRVENALVLAVTALETTIAEGTTRDADEEDAILAELKETLTTLGLADRQPGNPAKAEEAVAS